MAENTGKNTGLANLRPPWKAGDPSPNPKGRPLKSSSILQSLRSELAEIEPTSGKTFAELIAKALKLKAIKGDKGAIELAMRYTDGEPPRELRLAGHDGGPVEFVPKRVLADAAALAAGTAPEGGIPEEGPPPALPGRPGDEESEEDVDPRGGRG